METVAMATAAEAAATVRANDVTSLLPQMFDDLRRGPRFVLVFGGGVIRARLD
jgi:hypothetical protein